jgi:AbrB family looped-hinge helix DNA binding protein
MTTLVKVQRKGQVTLPTRLRSALGIAEGDIMVEATVQRGKIVLTPRTVIDRAAFPTADDDYTPAQRRIIDARLAQSREDIKKRRTIGPFDTAADAIASMKAELKKRAPVKKPKRADR